MKPSDFNNLKTDPGRTSLDTILKEFDKLQCIRNLALPANLFTGVSPKVLQQYRQRASVEPPRELRRHPDPIRYTLVAAFCWLRSQEITDNLVELLIQIVHGIKANLCLPAYSSVRTAESDSRENRDGTSLPNLQPILRRAINWELIQQQYDQMIKYATALRVGTAETEVILKRFNRSVPQHPTYQALAELGKAVKTIFLCQYLHSEALRQEIHEGLNVVERWNGANNFILYGKSSEIATNSLDEQQVTVLCMHLLQLCLVYINTLMLQRVLSENQWLEMMQPDDFRALTPLIWNHVNPYGLFQLDMNERLMIEESSEKLVG